MLQIIATLLGNEPAPILDGQVSNFIRKVNGDLDDLLWQATTQDLLGSSNLAVLVQELSSESRTGLALNPDFFAALCAASRTPSSDSFMELSRVISNASRESIPEMDDSNGVPSSVVVGETIRLDLRTDQARRIDPTSPIFFRRFEDPTQDETSTVIAKINGAISEIDEVSPTFGRLIRNYTRRIYFRKSDTEAPASEQIDTEIGAIRLRNVHISAYSQDQLMYDLIHESVHNFLCTFEYLNFPFVTFGGRNDRAAARPVSPWSRRPIQILPFLHAAFVYFAMSNYAKLRCGIFPRGSEARNVALKQYNRYISGFLVPGRLSQYAMGQADIDPRVLGALDWMQASVRRDASLRGRHPKSSEVSDVQVSQSVGETAHAIA